MYIDVFIGFLCDKYDCNFHDKLNPMTIEPS